MAQGTLPTQLQTLQTAMASIQALLGQPAGSGQAGSGLAGAASLAGNAPTDRVASFQGQFSGQISGVFHFDANASLGGVNNLFSGLHADASATPTQALTDFQNRVGQVNGAFSGDLLQQLNSALNAIRGISQGIPTDRTTIVNVLVDQILKVIGSIQGPEADKIKSWIQSVQELERVLLPVIEKARNAPDQGAVAIQVMEKVLASTLETFGFKKAKTLLKFSDEFFPNALPPSLTAAITTHIGAITSGFSSVQAAVAGPFPTFHDAAVTTARAMNNLNDRLQELVRILRKIGSAKILQPHALEKYLQSLIDRTLAVQVQDTQDISDPFKALFDKIDAAIAGINLDFVRTDVLGFFERTRNTINQVNIPSLATVVNQKLKTVQDAVNQLQQAVTDLINRVKAFFDGLVQKYRDLASNIGTFHSDGSFTFKFENDITEVFNAARLAIAGDPQNPSATSLAGTLKTFQQSIDGFATQLNNLLQPVGQAVNNVVTPAVNAINSFTTFLQGLNLPGLLDQLSKKLREIVDSLGPIKFDVVVDPVVGELKVNTEKLHGIDTSKINDMLREALRLALQAIVSVNFTAAISGPLKQQFADIKKHSVQDLIQPIQHAYEQALSQLDRLKPDNLLQALYAAFDTLNSKLSSLNVATLLQPLDDLHHRFLEQPLAQLKPSVLLKPAADSFHDAVSVFNNLSGAPVLAPVNSVLNQVKSAVAAFDISHWVDDVIAAIDKIKKDLQDIRPSQLLARLLPELQRLDQLLDQFKPSIVFQPVTRLAQPLLQMVENVQQKTSKALFDLFQAPLHALEELHPEKLTKKLQGQFDVFLGALDGLNIPATLAQLKGSYFDLTAAVNANGNEMKIAVTARLLSPDVFLGNIIAAYSEVIAIIRGLRDNMVLPNLANLYQQIRDRLLGMLPPYARQLLDPETFKRVMRLADPSRFLQELDTRFDALKNKLLPIRPQDIGAQLDATYEAVLAQVQHLDITSSLNQVKDIFNRVKGIVNTIRIDFVAADIDRAIADLKAVINALDPSKLFARLDGLHHEIELVVQATLPSHVLAGLQAPLDQIKQIVASVNPRTTLGPPLTQAWAAIEAVLHSVDFAAILKPILDKLDELELALEASLQKVEGAFDEMLTAAATAMGGGGSASASVSVSAGVSL